MKHLGDITKISGYGVPAVDIVVGGSPCQDLSVAGKREGLAGARSGLFMEQVRIVKEMRDGFAKSNRGANEHIRPRFMVWENVPGAFSSNKGEDFRAVLEEVARIADKTTIIPRPSQGKWSPSGAIMGDGWSIAWRVHDAQFWGVPQRRKRIALVADFGGGAAPEVLFERESVSGNIEESREARKGTTTDAEGSARKTSKCLNSWDVQSKHIQPEEGIAEALYSGECRGGGGESYVMQSKIFGISSYDSNAMKSSNPHSGVYEADTARTLDLNGGSPACNQGGMAVVCLEGNGSRPSHRGDGYTETDTMYTLNSTEHHAVCVESSAWDGSQVSPTLTANNANGAQRMPDKDNFNAVIVYEVDAYNQTQTEEQAKALNSAATASDHIPCVYGLDRAAFNQGKNVKFSFSIDEEKIGAQTAKGPGAVFQSVVRRLTPLECERLQGYPDGWTNIGECVDSKGKKHKDADSPRYKALGNSIALPFWEWMAARMVKYIDHKPTMASLFDGIGGFPLVFSRCGCTPIWASEIEEFPMAVTKLRFPSEEEQK